MVWSAFDQTQNCIVAVKLYVFDENNQAVNYLLLDHQLTGLHHPHVLPTFDFGVWQNIQYIVTPYIAGGSLEDRLHDREPFLLRDTLQYAAEIASALDYLHEKQVIHRDLKSANILINFNRHLYVADFDLARVLSVTTQSMHTGRGTPAYSPPEQHTMAQITPQSDIFSLGIVLFEMFTRKLPWNGEKSLGIQQLSSSAEIPDPCELIPDLPCGLVEALRKMTAANPNDRPRSAGEAMQMVYSSFEMESIMVSNDDHQDEASGQDIDAKELLEDSLERWEQSGETFNLNLTKFAVIELNYRGSDTTLPPTALRFMLNNSLVFGYHDDYWWDSVTDPKERITIAGQLVGKNNEVVSERLVDHLMKDHEIHSLNGTSPDPLTNSLLRTALKTNNDGLRKKILALILNLLKAPTKWQKTVFSAEDDINLAFLATQDTASGDKAAILIGHVRSESAAITVLRKAGAERRRPAFQAIRMTAGGLPASIPFNIRLVVTGEWLLQRLVARPVGLLLVFVMAFLGTAGGTSIQIYLTYRLPSFLDMERITISLERGGFLGVVFGLGILVARLIAERFPMLGAFPRVILSTILGGLGLNIGLFTYDVLFLKIAPNGILVTMGCLLIACGYALGTLFQNHPAKIVVSALATFTALAGSWWVHTNLAAVPTDISPLFFYEYTWANALVLGIASLVTLPMAILGNMFDLSLNE